MGTGEIRVKTDIARTPQNSPEGFYLISLMGSEQAGLGGPNGALIRQVAVGRSQSNLQDVLVNIRQTASALMKNGRFVLTKNDRHREHGLARANDCIGLYQHHPRRRRA